MIVHKGSIEQQVKNAEEFVRCVRVNGVPITVYITLSLYNVFISLTGQRTKRHNEHGHENFIYIFSPFL